MVDKNETASDSKTLLTKVIPKMNKAGSRQVGSMKIELKEFEGYKFIQMSQHKEGFGQSGSSRYRPTKDSWVTFDPNDKAIKEALQQAYKLVEK